MWYLYRGEYGSTQLGGVPKPWFRPLLFISSSARAPFSFKRWTQIKIHKTNVCSISFYANSFRIFSSLFQLTENHIKKIVSTFIGNFSLLDFWPNVHFCSVPSYRRRELSATYPLQSIEGDIRAYWLASFLSLQTGQRGRCTQFDFICLLNQLQPLRVKNNGKHRGAWHRRRGAIPQPWVTWMCFCYRRRYMRYTHAEPLSVVLRGLKTVLIFKLNWNSPLKFPTAHIRFVGTQTSFSCKIRLQGIWTPAVFLADK
jgi:hypothetical protein